jgi:formylglycine-generating enzyme required for sulfatase activity
MGGTFDRSYSALPASNGADAATGGPTADAATQGSDPATISSFRLDKYDVTVGRFRAFVNAALSADGGLSWVPSPGAGKHATLDGGQGLANVGPTDAGVTHEVGWLAGDDANIAPTASNLACSSLGTWTASASAADNLPINCVNWWEASAFCIWDGGFLPTETEWEYAAVGGNQQRPYPWGSADPGTANQYAIYNCNYPTSTADCATVASIAPVGTAALGAGPWGQLDVVGEMWQWTADWFQNAYVDPCVDCASLTGGSSRVVRGGSFRDDATNLSPTYRNANDPSLRNDFIGFRCARSGS